MIRLFFDQIAIKKTETVTSLSFGLSDCKMVQLKTVGSEKSVGKGLTSWLLLVMSNCVFFTFPYSILCQVWYLIVSIPDLCPISYFVRVMIKKFLAPWTSGYQGMKIWSLIFNIISLQCNALRPSLFELSYPFKIEGLFLVSQVFIYCI